jgi:NADH:ubiquinone oxidoreductase subunit C
VRPEFGKKLLAVPGAGRLEARRDGLWMTAPNIDVLALAKVMHEREGRLSTVTAVCRKDGETELIYHYMLEGEAINVRARTRGKTIASVAPVTKAAEWIEREIHDFFGVSFEGHPGLERLLRPAQLPAGFFVKK